MSIARWVGTPSRLGVNRANGWATKHVYTKEEHRRARNDLTTCLQIARVCGRLPTLLTTKQLCYVTIGIVVRDKSRLDVDACTKAVLDCLQRSLVLKNDSQVAAQMVMFVGGRRDAGHDLVPLAFSDAVQYDASTGILVRVQPLR